MREQQNKRSNQAPANSRAGGRDNSSRDNSSRDGSPNRNGAQRDRNGGNSNRARGRQQGSSREQAKSWRFDGISDAVLIGEVKEQPEYSAGDGKKSSWMRFRVKTEIDIGGSKDISGIHTVEVYGDVADQLENDKKLDGGDVVKVTGRLSYSAGRGGSPFAKIVVDNRNDGSVEILDNAEAESDENSIALLGEITRVTYTKPGRHNPAVLLLSLTTPVQVNGRDEPIAIRHQVALYDQLAGRFFDDTADGVVIRVNGRLQYAKVDTDAEGQPVFEPRVTLDDLSGSIELEDPSLSSAS